MSNHVIGQRALDVSAWVASRWVVPSQDKRQLWVIHPAAAPADAAPVVVAMPSPVSALQTWQRGGAPGVAARLQDGSAWWVPAGV
jgi:hypothetical protein